MLSTHWISTDWIGTRWIKLLRDIEATPWRIALMLLTIAAGVFSFALMLSSYTVLTREVRNNYLATNPASATLNVDRIDASLLAGVRHFPGIAQAQASSTLGVTLYSADGTPNPLTILVVEDFNQLHINTFFADRGAWPPLPNSLLMERSSVAQLQAKDPQHKAIKIGDNLSIGWNDGRVSQIKVSGTVQDPGVAVPNLSAFAYVSPSTLDALGVTVPLTELKITVSDKPFDNKAIEETTTQLAAWIQQQGHKVTRIRIPPAGEHPHQKIMLAVLGAFLLFSGITLVLSAVLTATIIDGLMAQQVRQIGVMKAIGASGTQIAGLYLTFILILSALATALAMPAGLTAGLSLSKAVLTNLNFVLQSSALPDSIYLVLMAAGVLIPLLVAAVPIIKATQTSAQNALTDLGTSRQYYSGTTHFAGAKHYAGIKLGLWLSWSQRLPGVDRSLIMALRNTFRRRGRLMLLLALLSSAGAMFMGTLNLKKASQEHLIAAAADRHYDLEIVLNTPEDQQKIRAIIQSLDGVDVVEPWGVTTLGRHRPDGFNIERTYADGGHGAFFLRTIPQGSQLLSLQMLRGNWLKDTSNNRDSSKDGNAEGDDTVVLNHEALESFPNTDVGDEITLGFAGNSRTLRVVGIAEQKMTSGTAYVSAATYQKLTGQDERYRNYRIVMKQHNDIFVENLAKKIEAALLQQQIKVNLSITENRLRFEVDVHFTLLINALFFIAILMAVVGVFGLASVLNTHIAERTREFGIMRSIGASSRIIVRNIILESLFIGLMSWVIAIVLSLPLSIVISNFLGDVIFGEVFPLAVSFSAQLVWLSFVVTGAILASLYPAKKAAQITIRESFAI